MAAKKKRVQNKKRGKVIRLSDEIVEYVNSIRKAGETWDDAMRRLLKERTPMWTLPSKLLRSKSEANGLAIYEAAKNSIPPEDRETPVKVFGP